MKTKKRINMYLPDDLYQQIKIMSVKNKRTFTEEVAAHLRAALPPKPKPGRVRTAEEQNVINLIRKFTERSIRGIPGIVQHCNEAGCDEKLVLQVLRDYSKEDQDQEFWVMKNPAGEPRYRRVDHGLR